MCGADLRAAPLIAGDGEGTRKKTTSRSKRSSKKPAAAAGLHLAGLGHALVRGLRLVSGWTVLSLAVLGIASLALTFAPPNADAGAALLAAWHYLWLSLLIGAAVAWAAGACYDTMRTASRLAPWSTDLSYADALLGIALPGLLVLSASRDGAVPPSAWGLAALASAAGFVATLGIRVALERISRPKRAKLVALGICAAVVGATLLVAPTSDIPSRNAQRSIDRRVSATVRMSACSPRPIAPLPAGLFRNSLTGIVHCHQGRIQGRFLTFHNAQLLAIYVSQKHRAAENHGGHSDRHCQRRSGVYVGSWFDRLHQEGEIGELYCYGRTGGATIEWEDPRSDLFASIHGFGRKRLYRWWRRHSTSIRSRG